jgi:hypothetical protein
VDEASKVRERKTNSEIRRWYLERIATIVELNQVWIRRGLSTRDRAERAWLVRYEARRGARAMMADKRERELLRARDTIRYGSPDGPSFEFLVARLKQAGVDEDAAYEAIIDTSFRSDSEVNRLLGLQ